MSKLTAVRLGAARIVAAVIKALRLGVADGEPSPAPEGFTHGFHVGSTFSGTDDARLSTGFTDDAGVSWVTGGGDDFPFYVVDGLNGKPAIEMRDNSRLQPSPLPTANAIAGNNDTITIAMVVGARAGVSLQDLFNALTPGFVSGPEVKVGLSVGTLTIGVAPAGRNMQTTIPSYVDKTAVSIVGTGDDNADVSEAYLNGGDIPFDTETAVTISGGTMLEFWFATGASRLFSCSAFYVYPFVFDAEKRAQWDAFVASNF